MRIEVHGIEEVAGGLRQIDPKLAIILKRQMNIACEALRERIVLDLVAGVWGIKSRRGTAGLAGTVHQMPAEQTPEGIVGGVKGGGDPALYGRFFEEGGRGPYEIVGKPVLAWPAFGKFQANTKQRKFGFTADMIFAKRVTHPAIKRAPWMSGPLGEMRNAILEILKPGDIQGEIFKG